MDMQNIYRRFIKSVKYNIDEFIEECISIWCKREKNRMIIRKEAILIYSFFLIRKVI